MTDSPNHTLNNEFTVLEFHAVGIHAIIRNKGHVNEQIHDFSFSTPENFEMQHGTTMS